MGFEQVRDVQVVGLSCSVFDVPGAFGSRSGFQSLGSSVERVFWEFRVSRFGCPQVNFCSFLIAIEHQHHCDCSLRSSTCVLINCFDAEAPGFPGLL